MALSGLSNFYSEHLILEMDCAAIARELTRDGTSRSACFAMISDIGRKSAGFSSIEIKVVSRQRNKLGHEIVPATRDWGDHLLIADVHPNARQVMLDECNPTMV